MLSDMETDVKWRCAALTSIIQFVYSTDAILLLLQSADLGKMAFVLSYRFFFNHTINDSNNGFENKNKLFTSVHMEISCYIKKNKKKNKSALFLYTLTLLSTIQLFVDFSLISFYGWESSIRALLKRGFIINSSLNWNERSGLLSEQTLAVLTKQRM